MDFGVVERAAIPFVDFKLPPDGLQTRRTFESLTKAEKPEFYVGASKWGRREWIGKIFPQKTKEADFLTAYAKHFHSMELNAVFYSVPTPDIVCRFRQKVEASGNPDFLFFPKLSRTISHIKRLKDAEVPTEMFLESIRNLGGMLGPCFLQLGDNFGPKNFQVLAAYLKHLPKDLQFFCEIRHEEWFADAKNRQEYFNLLAEQNIGAVITDTGGRRDVLHMELTIPEVYIRFVANGDEYLGSDYTRIDDWIQRIKIWLDQGLKKVYFMINPVRDNYTPELCRYAIHEFNKVLGAEIPPVHFLSQDL